MNKLKISPLPNLPSGRILTALLLAGAVLTGCGQRHFLTGKAYRAAVHADYVARMTAHDGALAPWMQWPEPGVDHGAAVPQMTREEREAMEFLYAYMPLADVTDYTPDFYLSNVRTSFRIRAEMPWKVPEREFRHFVLPLRVNNENLDSSRVVFFDELKPRVQGLSMEEAILEVNHWCHEKVTYQPSDARTTSPLSTVKNALGRCGEESTFTVAALRSVGIPARQVYTPRWAHTDDNHAWVEAWADGQWHFLGACEPEPVLDLGWFNAPASRAMLTHTKVFGRYDGPEEVVLVSPNYTEVNLIGNYAETAQAGFKVVWGPETPLAGEPVDSARVDFCIYNYAEFYPAVTRYTDARGMVSLSSGLGDLLVWASKDGAFGFAQVSFGKDREVTVEISPLASPGRNDSGGVSGRDDGDGKVGRGEKEGVVLTASLRVVPPPEKVRLPDVSAEQRAENDLRFAREDSLRHAYEATFPSHEEALAFVREYGYSPRAARFIGESRGNWRTIEQFLCAASDPGRAEALLGTLGGKDLRDASLENLMDSYEATGSVLAPRIENEFLSPYKAFFKEYLTPEEQAALREPAALVVWVQEHITVIDDPKAWRIPMSPAGVYRSGLADPRSRDIFFVALARTLGTEARKDPVTGKIQYRETAATDPEAGWLDVQWNGDTPAQAAPKGLLRLNYTPDGVIDNPKYYSHFTVSRLGNGRPGLLTFDEGEVDMGGGVDWQHVFQAGYPLDAGLYMLTSGNRLSDGSVPVTLQLFEVREGETTVLDLPLARVEGAVSVIGSFDAETRFLPAGEIPGQAGNDGKGQDGNDGKIEAGGEQSLLSVTGRGYYAVILLEPGKEPTNHVLRDLAAARTALEAWGRPILLLTRSEAELSRLQAEIADGRYGTLPATAVFGIDTGAVLSGIERGMKVGPSGPSGAPSHLPLVLLADTFNRVFFFSEGYTIGLGDQLAHTVAQL